MTLLHGPTSKRKNPIPELRSHQSFKSPMRRSMWTKTKSRKRRGHIRSIPIGTFYEPWILVKADSRYGCLLLPLTGYFLCFFRKCAENADVAVTYDNLLFRCSGIMFPRSPTSIRSINRCSSSPVSSGISV